MRYVYRDWLWWGTLAGALFWWVIAVQAGGPSETWLGPYLALLGWDMLAIRSGNWRLTRPVNDPLALEHGRDWLAVLKPGKNRDLLYGLGLLVLAQGWGMTSLSHSLAAPWHWLALPALILITARFQPLARILPWPMLLIASGGLLTQQLRWVPAEFPGWALIVLPLEEGRLTALWSYLALLGLLFAAGGLWQLRVRPNSALAASLSVIAPLVAVATAYLIAGGTLPGWGTSLLCLLYGGLLLTLAGRRLQQGRQDNHSFWQLAAGHLAYSLAVVITFEAATLTLALALQLVSLTWLQRRFALEGLNVLVKLVLGIVIIRLTLNPWLLSYELPGLWILTTYGGSFLLTLLASRMTAADNPLRRWLEGGALHLLVLFLFIQTRYWLYDGDLFTARYDFLEAAINTNLWAALALVYYWRRRFAAMLAGFYRTAAGILMGLALFSYLYLLTTANPLFGGVPADSIAATPIANALLIAYGLPVLLWALASRLYEPGMRPFMTVLSGFGLWLFVSFQIRHLWQGELHWAASASDGELYSYSIVWLLMAVTAMLTAHWKHKPGLYQAGLVLLVVVILKVFMIDMAGLTGLLRALSFLGLGLSLLGLAHMHQYLKISGKRPEQD